MPLMLLLREDEVEEEVAVGKPHAIAARHSQLHYAMLYYKTCVIGS